jgi:hypothetical protein
MAEIVLAEYGGQAWLVGGEQYIDDLLANTLPPDISIELVACESKAEVNVLWAQNTGPLADFGAPWMIHPKIADRVRRGSVGRSVFFAQWSAMLDEDARAVIRAAATWAAQNEGSSVVLTRFVGLGGTPALVSLADLRADLIAAELVALGISRDRIGRETRDVTTAPGMGEESQRVDIGVRIA